MCTNLWVNNCAYRSDIFLHRIVYVLWSPAVPIWWYQRHTWFCGISINNRLSCICLWWTVYYSCLHQHYISKEFLVINHSFHRCTCTHISITDHNTLTWPLRGTVIIKLLLKIWKYLQYDMTIQYWQQLLLDIDPVMS